METLGTSHLTELKKLSKLHRSLEGKHKILYEANKINPTSMLKYYSSYSKNIGINNKNATAEILYSAESCQNNSSTRAEKIIQRTKRKIIISYSGTQMQSNSINF